MCWRGQGLRVDLSTLLPKLCRYETWQLLSYLEPADHRLSNLQKLSHFRNYCGCIAHIAASPEKA